MLSLCQCTSNWKRNLIILYRYDASNWFWEAKWKINHSILHHSFKLNNALQAINIVDQTKRETTQRSTPVSHCRGASNWKRNWIMSYSHIMLTMCKKTEWETMQCSTNISHCLCTENWIELLVELIVFDLKTDHVNKYCSKIWKNLIKNKHCISQGE